MKDIEVIGGDLSYEKVKELPSVHDRIRAISYHCRLIDNYCSTEEFDEARWHFRGALSEFKSIFDVLPHDLRMLQLDKIWNNSKFSKHLEDDILVKVLKKIRNLALHTAHIKGDKRKFCFKLLDGTGEYDTSAVSVFIDPINGEHFTREGSIQKAKSTADWEIAWFNKQTQFWPAHLIIEEGRFRTCLEFINFLSIKEGTDSNLHCSQVNH